MTAQHRQHPTAEGPVIIAGAGPCGLVAAATLQDKGLPFVIVEKAKRDRICSNAGSGFDLAPTAMDILQHRLQINGIADIMRTYNGLFVEDMNGKKIRNMDLRTNKKEKKRNGASVNRAELQNLLLDHLFPSKTAEEGILLCDLEIVSYVTDTTSKNCVTVTMSDGTTLQGSVLLGCDGIRSNIRKCMMDIQQVEDPLHFCDSIAYWGKCPRGKEGSKLEKAIRPTQSHAGAEGTCAITGMGTIRTPGSFFGIPINDTVVWGFFVQSTQEPGVGNDLTRRGGSVLTEEEKKELLQTLQNESVCRLCIEHTEPSSITRAALYDRKYLDLPYSDQSNRVVLLGDAAHPQTPYMGQGANMAIVDAYVLCARLANQPVVEAVQAFDTKSRRDGVKHVVQLARNYARYLVSSNWFFLWGMRAVMLLLPVSTIESLEAEGDTANMAFMQAADRDFAAL